MYLSRIKLDLSRDKTMRALVNPNIIHGALDSSQIGERTRKLWRIDALNGDLYLLILSDDKIDYSVVASQIGFVDSIEEKDYSPLINRVPNGTVWRFRLRANPTVKKYDAPKNKSMVMAHITPEHQMEWLRRKAEKNGFRIDDNHTLVTESKWYDFKKNGCGDHVRLLSVTYEGILTVTDTNLFTKALLDGIGREKAYGMGLLTIVSC